MIPNLERWGNPTKVPPLNRPLQAVMFPQPTPVFWTSRTCNKRQTLSLVCCPIVTTKDGCALSKTETASPLSSQILYMPVLFALLYHPKFVCPSRFLHSASLVSILNDGFSVLQCTIFVCPAVFDRPQPTPNFQIRFMTIQIPAAAFLLSRSIKMKLIVCAFWCALLWQEFL